jgi:hypothetical protein
MRRQPSCQLVLLAGLIFLFTGAAVHAAETWTCSASVNGKQFPVKYEVHGQVLLHGDGSASSKILLNDENLLISFASFMSPATRNLMAQGVARIDDMFTMYFVIDKRRGGMVVLGGAWTMPVPDVLGKLPPPDFRSLPCTKD